MTGKRLVSNIDGFQVVETQQKRCSRCGRIYDCFGAADCGICMACLHKVSAYTARKYRGLYAPVEECLDSDDFASVCHSGKLAEVRTVPVI